MQFGKYCPIMTIGFNAPENKNEPDLRLCNLDCAWYNIETEECILHTIHNDILELTDYTCATSMELN